MGWPARRSGARAAPLVAVAVLAAVASLLAVLAPAASARSSDHGASFAVRCDYVLEPDRRLSDDPIVHPNMPGEAHSHDFFGNLTTDAHSTYESLLGQETTCTRPEDTAAYWLPTVSWNGMEVDSNRAVFYYRAGGKDHKKVKPFPAGLKIIAGNEKRVTWRCGRTDNGGGTQNPPSQCDSPEPGEQPELGVRIIFPDCVDVTGNGEPRLDSEDHRSHMVYSRPIDGRVRCPRSHPRSVPVLTMNATFLITTDPGKVTLSSGGASTMHADFFNAWDQEELNRLVVTCINQVPPSKPRPDECQANPSS